MQDEFWDIPDTVDEIDTERVHPRQHEEVANMTPYEFSRQRAESMPPWLANFRDLFQSAEELDLEDEDAGPGYSRI